jgi:protein-S-isoprenylcysteine O-methyltransferase Ste14
VKATDTEFRFRFFVIAAIFFAAFSCYWIDGRNLTAFAARRIAGAAHLDEALVARLIFAGAALVAAAAAALRTWAAAYLSAEVVGDPRLRTERLVADGPYRRVRNPLYLALLLQTSAFTTLMSAPGAAVALTGMTVFALRLVRREEDALLASQGDAYARYCAALPRFMPSLRPRLPPAGGAPRLAQAILSELFMWSMAAALAAFAATFDTRLLWGILGAGFAAYAIARTTIRLRESSGRRD